MRNRPIPPILFAGTIALLTVACAPKAYVPKANEEFYGTWINEKTINDGHIQKKISNADGNLDFFNVSDTKALFEDRQEIDSKWTDSEGNIWYKIHGTVSAGLYVGTKWQELDKLSKSATIWEYVYAIVPQFDPKLYPTRIDPSGPNYRVFYRSQQ